MNYDSHVQCWQRSRIEIWQHDYPHYPNLGAKVARLRRGKDRRAHGEAVLTAINALNRSALQRELPSTKPTCASGTAHTSGEAILKAVRQQHARSLASALAADHKFRDDDWYRGAYEAAMAEKGKARAAERMAKLDTLLAA